MTPDFYEQVADHQTHFFTSFESFQWCMQHHAACYSREARFSAEWHESLREYLNRQQLSMACHNYLQKYEGITGDVLPVPMLADDPVYSEYPWQYPRFLARFREHIQDPLQGYSVLKKALRCHDGNEERVGQNPLWELMIKEVCQMPLSEKMVGLLMIYQLGVYNLLPESKVMASVMETWRSFISSCTIHQQHAWVDFFEDYTTYKGLVVFLKEAMPLGYQPDYANWPDKDDIVHYHVMGGLIKAFELGKRHAGIHLYHRYDEVGAMKVCAQWHINAAAKVLGLGSRWVTMLQEDKVDYHNRTLTVAMLWERVQLDYPVHHSPSYDEVPLY